jgi:cytochrome b pre-mRNA-processing protein 3
MFTNLLPPRGNRRIIDGLHSHIVAAARHPALFLPPYEVPDTTEGRFDLLVLLAILLLRRLEGLPHPAPEVAQELVDTMFEHLDAGLREVGVGDLGVPKRIKKLAEAFTGRNRAYRSALAENRGPFAEALARNIYGQEGADPRADALAAYCRHAIAALEHADLAQILTEPPFPNPETTDVPPC